MVWALRRKPRIWFTRDPQGYALLNVDMPTTSSEERVVIEENFWTKKGRPTDLECPPSGKALGVTYANGDSLAVRFDEIESALEFESAYPAGARHSHAIRFPITCVEVHANVAGTEIRFDEKKATFPGSNSFVGCFFGHCPIGLSM